MIRIFHYFGNISQFYPIKFIIYYIIIIDQYKNDKYDSKFKGLNKIVNIIRSYNTKIKIILSTTINNTDSKENFIKNLDDIYYVEDIPIPSEQILDFDLYSLDNNYLLNSDIEEVDSDIKFDDKDDRDNKSVCSYYENIIIEEQKKFKKNKTNKEREK